MLYLNVPYREKDEAKSLGACWNPAAKKWYVNDKKTICGSKNGFCPPMVLFATIFMLLKAFTNAFDVKKTHTLLDLELIHFGTSQMMRKMENIIGLMHYM